MMLTPGHCLYEEQQSVLFSQSADVLVSVGFLLIVFISVFQIHM